MSEIAIQELRPVHAVEALREPRRLQYWSWGMPVFAAIWLIVMWLAFPRPLSLIESNWPLFFVGFAGATLGNATAIGGGLVFIPVMIFVYGLSPVLALKLALASQCFGMTSGAIGWTRRGVVPLKALWLVVPLLLGCTFSSLVIQPNSLLVKGLFGPVSISLGILTLLLIDRHGTNEHIPYRPTPLLFAVALIGGIITGWVAIGEGEIVAALLMLVYGLRAERAIGLGVVLLSFSSIYLTVIHQYFLGGISWDLALFTGFGCVFGGRMGPYLSQWIGTRRLKIAFATIAIGDGLLFVAQLLSDN